MTYKPLTDNQLDYAIFHIELNYGKFQIPQSPVIEHQFYNKWGRNAGWFKDRHDGHRPGQEFYEEMIREYPEVMEGLTPADIAYGIEYGMCSFYTQSGTEFTIQKNIPLVRWGSKLNQERARRFRVRAVAFGFMTMEQVKFLMEENKKTPSSNE